MSVTVKQLSSAIVKNKDIDSFVRDQLRNRCNPYQNSVQNGV